MNSIKNIIRARSEWLLAACGILMAAAIIWLIVWGVARIAQDIGSSLSVPDGSGSGEQFDLDAASELNFRGLSGG